MIELRPCACGHAIEAHGGDKDYPGSTACRDDAACPCIAYEADEDEPEDDPKPPGYGA